MNSTSSVGRFPSLPRKNLDLPFTAPVEHVICLGNHMVWVYFDNQQSLTFNCLSGKVVKPPKKLDYEAFRVCALSERELAIYAWEKRQLYIFDAITGEEKPFTGSRLPTIQVCSEVDFANETSSRNLAACSDIVGVTGPSWVVLKETKDIQNSTPTIVLTAFNKTQGATERIYEFKATQPSVFVSAVNKTDSVVAFVQDTGAEGSFNFYYWNVINNLKRHIVVKGFSKETIITDVMQWTNKDLVVFGNPGEEKQLPFMRVVQMDKALAEESSNVEVSTDETIPLNIGKEFMLEEIFSVNENKGQLMMLYADDPNPCIAKLTIVDKSVVRFEAKKEVNAQYIKVGENSKYFVLIDEPEKNQYTQPEPSHIEFETGLMSNRILYYWMMKQAKLNESYGKEILKEIIEYLDEN